MAYSVVPLRTDNVDRLLQLHFDNCLFLTNTNFRHKEKHHLMWQPPTIDSMEDLNRLHYHHSLLERLSSSSRSFRNTCLDLHHVKVRERTYLSFTGRKKTKEKTLEFSLVMKKLRTYFMNN